MTSLNIVEIIFFVISLRVRAAINFAQHYHPVILASSTIYYIIAKCLAIVHDCVV
jgi:hypothetical protein